MPYNEKLAERIRGSLKGKRGITEKKMFGGVCFMIYGNMALGVEKDSLVVRVGPDSYEKVVKRKYARPMDFTGRPLKGFVYVSPEGIKTKASLVKWLDLGISFAKNLPKKY